MQAHILMRIELAIDLEKNTFHLTKLCCRLFGFIYYCSIPNSLKDNKNDLYVETGSHLTFFQVIGYLGIIFEAKFKKLLLYDRITRCSQILRNGCK